MSKRYQTIGTITGVKYDNKGDVEIKINSINDYSIKSSLKFGEKENLNAWYPNCFGMRMEDKEVDSNKSGTGKIQLIPSNTWIEVDRKMNLCIEQIFLSKAKVKFTINEENTEEEPSTKQEEDAKKDEGIKEEGKDDKNLNRKLTAIELLSDNQ